MTLTGKLKSDEMWKVCSSEQHSWGPCLPTKLVLEEEVGKSQHCQRKAEFSMSLRWYKVE